MKKVLLSLVLFLILSGAFGLDVNAQIEGTASTTGSFSATYKALPMGNERVQVTYEVWGVVINDTGEGFLHNASFRCLGALHAVNGEYNDDSGFCVYTCPEGNQMFQTYKATGKMGVGGKGTATFVGGTGKLTGLQGSSEFTRVNVRPAAEGTFQGYHKAKGQYKLP